MKRFAPIACMASVCCVLSLTAAAMANSYDDDFSSATPKDQWNYLIDPPSGNANSLAQYGGRLNVLSTNTLASPTDIADDALFISTPVSTGFQMSTAADFEIQAIYSFTNATLNSPGGAFSIVFGVGRDLDGTDSAAIGHIRAFGLSGFGVPDGNSVVAAWRSDDAQTQDFDVPDGTSGTFVISYDFASDRLTLTDGSYSQVVPIDVRGAGGWNASDLYVSLGARGAGYTVVDGEAYFDSFTIVSGDVVPEPASVLLLLAGAGAILARRRRTA